MISTSSPQTGTDKIAASKMSLKAWISVLTQQTHNPSSSDSSFNTSRAPKRISRVSAKMTASSAKSRSEILTFPNNAPQLDEVVESVSKDERVVIGADFNGHVGEGNKEDEEVMGRYGLMT